jgi:hypothetical protein
MPATKSSHGSSSCAQDHYERGVGTKITPLKVSRLGACSRCDVLCFERGAAVMNVRA